MSTSASWLEIHRGSAPLLLSLPHTGTDLPDDVLATLRDPALARYDTDWWVQRLYDFALELDATIVRTPISRTVIDVNRDPSGASLYPGQATTGLCPTERFNGDSLYHEGQVPDADEIDRRRRVYFCPYHDAIAAELARLRSQHPAVVLYDAHSIRAVVPRLFEGRLPDFNVGTNGGTSCAPALRQIIVDAIAGEPYTHVVDGRFRGGWITRHYGRPVEGIHAIQMELAQDAYMDEPEDFSTPVYDPARAAPMRTRLQAALTAAVAWARRH